MFKGNWIVNLVLACFAFIIVFSASFYNNLLSTTLIRASIAFVVCYLLGYLFRWLAFLAFASEENLESESESKSENVDTPNEPEEPIQELALDDEEIQLSEEDVLKTSQFVKDLLDNEEG